VRREVFLVYEEEFGRLVKKQRRRLGMSARALSQHIGLSPSYISQLERGLIKKPTYEIARKIGDHLDISEDVLLFFGIQPPDDDAQSEQVGPEPSDDEILLQLKHDKARLFALISRFCETDPYTAYTLLSYLNELLEDPDTREFLSEILDRCRFFESDRSRELLLQLIDSEIIN
jgi:transcriptional regulator with XRE-family HTH domain